MQQVVDARSAESLVVRVGQLTVQLRASELLPTERTSQAQKAARPVSTSIAEGAHDSPFLLLLMVQMSKILLGDLSILLEGLWFLACSTLCYVHKPEAGVITTLAC